MKIAVLIGGLRFDTQRRLMEGILEKAKADGTDLYVFTCDSWTYSSFYYSKGETAIFSLPNLNDYDGIILHGDTVYDKRMIEAAVKRIRKSKVPCISLNVRYPDMLFAGMDNANGIYEITDHLIHKHGAKKFAFISGPRGNSDSEERWTSFQKALDDHGIAFDTDYFFIGDYHPEGGKKGVDAFAKLPGGLPDAIVAANDEMAMGAYYRLKEMGIQVPEQVMVTGYDNIAIAKNHIPPVTSVMRPERELGEKAYDILTNYIKTGDAGEEEILKSRPIFRETCGCHEEGAESESVFRMESIREKLHVTNYSEIVKSSSADFTGVASFDELLVQIKKYIRMINPEEFYMCHCVVDESRKQESDFDITNEMKTDVLTQYSENISIPLAYRNGRFESYGTFPAKELLPAKYKHGGTGVFDTIVPLHYQDRCFGYCVLRNSRLMMESDLFHLFIMNINNAIENLRKQSMLNSMVNRLNRMWIYDTLTEVFNRAGFFKFAPNMVKQAIEKKENLFVLFLDLDGLKMVNDVYGHDEGDSFIKEMSAILRRVHGNGELLMRYGGDEFVVMSSDYSHAEAKAYVKRVNQEIESYNAASNKPYELSASMGYRLVEPTEDINLEDLIELADQEMYKVKNAKKAAKGQK